MLSILGRKTGTRSSSSDRRASIISTSHMENVVQKLLGLQNRKSTVRTYLNILRQFNRFVMSLGILPTSREARTTLYIANLIEEGKQSSSIKSYVSAIKKMLVSDGYKWHESEVLLTSLTKACRMINDRVKTRLPICCGYLEMILFEVERYFSSKAQHYLECLYKAIFILSYYGMMRVGEVTQSPHVLRTKNVHLATNKDKLLLILYTSKTHGVRHRPQKIKITSNKAETNAKKATKLLHRHFCPFKVLRTFIALGAIIMKKMNHFLYSGTDNQ